MMYHWFEALVKPGWESQIIHCHQQFCFFFKVIVAIAVLALNVHSGCVVTSPDSRQKLYMCLILTTDLAHATQLHDDWMLDMLKHWVNLCLCFERIAITKIGLLLLSRQNYHGRWKSHLRPVIFEWYEKSDLKICILLLPSSTMAMFPFSSMATPRGRWNSLGPLPCLPSWLKYSPFSVNICTRLLPVWLRTIFEQPILRTDVYCKSNCLL